MRLLRSVSPLELPLRPLPLRPRPLRLRSFATGVVAVPLLALTACGSGSTPTTTSTADATGSPAVSGTASVSAAANLGPAVPAATVVAPAVALTELPTATGKVGEKPTLRFPKNTPPPSLQRTILTKGSGPLTKTGDYLVTNYLGQVWGGKVFDNSYDKKTTATFKIADGQVVPGWVVALAGVPVGSRVLLSLPPADGYSIKGNPQAGIKPTDTIVFVVDVVSDVASDQAGQADAVLQPAPKGLPTVSGALGKEPKITIPKGLAEPKTGGAYLLAKGTGAKVKAGEVLAQLVVTDWAQSQPAQSTYPKTGAAAASANPSSTGLQKITVDATGALKGLIGQPLGSRVLVLVPSTTDASGQPQAGVVAVVDLVAQG